MARLVLLFSVFCFSLLSGLFAQQKVNFVTYGAFANPKEGDDDFMQIFFIKAEDNDSDSLSIEIFDADCAGMYDVPFKGKFNSQFKFSLFGGVNAFTPPSLRTFSPNEIDVVSGRLINKIIVTDKEKYDNSWYVLTKVEKEEGEFIDGAYYFKLVVQGISGDDANVFNIRAIGSKGESIKIFSYKSTVHLLPGSNIIQLRFFSGNNSKIIVKNYDADRTGVYFTSPYRSRLRLKSSSDGNWRGSSVKLFPFEENEICAVEFGRGGRRVNDAKFFIQDLSGNSLPIYLPIETKYRNNKPVIKKEIQKTEDCNTVVVDASSSYDIDGDSLSFKWLLPNGEIKNGTTQELTFSKPGKYKIVLAVADNSDAVERGKFEEFSIRINSAPIAVAGADKFRMPDEKIYFNGSKSFDKDGVIKSYHWNFGDGSEKSGKKVYHSYKKFGNYTVVLSVKDNSSGNCNTDSDSLNVVINAAPVAVAGSDIRCAVGEVITLDGSGSYDPDGNIVSYQWFLGNGKKDSGEKIFYKYNRGGKYKVTLRVKDNSNLSNGRSDNTINVWVNKPPKAYAGKDLVIAVGESFTLNGNKSKDSDGKITEFIWTLPDGKIFNKEILTYSFTQPGKYKIALKVKDDSETQNNYSEDFVTVVVNAPPKADAGNNVYQTDRTVLFDGSKSYDPDGKIVKYNWDFGDGSFGNKKKLQHKYAKPGIYTAKLTVYDNSSAKNNKSVDEIIIRINNKPIADAGADIIVAPGEEFKLSSLNSVDIDGKIISTEWEIGNKTISSKKEFSYSLSKPGEYIVRLKVADDSKQNDAVGFDEVIVRVNEPPHIVTQEFYKIAQGEVISFDATKSYDKDGKILHYEWYLNNKLISELPKFDFAFNNSGEEKLKLVLTDNSHASNARSETEIIVRVNAAPVIPKLSDIVQCSKTVELTAEGSFDSDGDSVNFKWDFGDGISAKGKTVTHRYSESGVYPVVLTADDGAGVSNSVSKRGMKIKINTPPFADAGEDEIACTGDWIILDASESFDVDGDLLKYEWDFGDSTHDTGISVGKTYVEPGLYEVKLKVTDNSGVECNSSINTKIIHVVESPVAFAGEDIIGCANNPIEFNAFKSTDSDGIVNSFKWDFGDGNFGGGVKTSHIYDTPGVYTVILTITGEETKECDNMDTDELVVTVEAAPKAEFVSEDSVAQNIEVHFDASNSDGSGSNIVKYSWDFGDGSKTEYGKTIKHKFAKAGNYFVTLSVLTDSKAECKSATFVKSIYVNMQPVAVAGNDKSGIVNELLSFDASSSVDYDGKIKKYIWDFGDGEKDEGINVFHSYKKKGNYRVILKVVDNTDLSNNSATDSLNVVINNYRE